MVQQSDVDQYATFLHPFLDKKNLTPSWLHVFYTLSNEHFGMVSLEAMDTQCPAVAVNSGGPLESVVHSITGFPFEPDLVHFSEAIEKFIHEPSLKATMGLVGRTRVKESFPLKHLQNSSTSEQSS